MRKTDPCQISKAYNTFDNEIGDLHYIIQAFILNLRSALKMKKNSFFFF